MRFKDAAVGTFGWFVWLLSMILYVSGGLIHLWTILIAYGESGFLAATITFFVPVGSQIYWIAYISSKAGMFFNTYTIIICAYLIGWIITIGLGYLAAHLSNKLEERDYESNSEKQDCNKLTDEIYMDIDEKATLFIGKNIDKYKNAWSKNNKISWNWASFLFGTAWMVYRKMYATFVIFFIVEMVIGAILAALEINYLFFTIPLKIIFGLFGNHLYFMHFNRKVRKATEYNITSDKYFEKIGGVSKLGVVIYMVLYLIIYICLTLM
ncbi:MAG: DUF2628 domain-containing protein [Desulfitobacteriia bacterium]|jgi:hypothetical protein